MYDYYKRNRDVFEIIERDDGFIEAYTGPRDYISPFKEWAAHQKAAIEYATGRIWILAAARGDTHSICSGKVTK